MSPILKHPSAWIPVALSVATLVMILSHIAIFGVVHEIDEGTAAHLFQIWLLLEAFMVAFFAIKWLPQRPKQAFFVLVIQIVAVLLACAPVFYFKL